MILNRWKQCSVTLIGTDHIKNTISCQDVVAEASKNGVHVIALSDGAGSKKHSDIGATIAANTICDLMTCNFDGYYISLEEDTHKNSMLGKDIVSEISRKIKVKAKRMNADYSDFACTLLFYVIKDDDFITGHIGDGLIVELHNVYKDVVITASSMPENNGGPNVTYFITDSDANENFRISSGKLNQNFKAAILMSDGPEEVLYDQKFKDVNSYLANLVNLYDMKNKAEYKSILKNFLDDKIRNYTSDDMSMNILYKESISFRDIKKHPIYIADLEEVIRSKCRIKKTSSYNILFDDAYQDRLLTNSSLREVLDEYKN